jgi:hypothetical protein
MKQIKDWVNIYEGSQWLLAHSLESLEVILVCSYHDLNCLLRRLESAGTKLVGVDELEQVLEGGHWDILNSDDWVLLLFHPMGKHIEKYFASVGNNALVGSDLLVPSHHKGHISEHPCVKHAHQVSTDLGRRHLHSDLQSPQVIEAELTVVASEDIQVPFDQCQSVSASGSGEETSLLLTWVLDYLDGFPGVSDHVIGVDIVKPLETIVSSEVVDLVVYEAACGRDSCTGLLTIDLGRVPLHGGRVQAPDVVELSELVGLSSEDEDLGLVWNSWVLQSAAGTHGGREVSVAVIVVHEWGIIIAADGHLHHHVWLVILG